MDDIVNEAQALVQCKSCPWYKNCVLPLRVTEEDLRQQLGNTIPGAPADLSSLGMGQFLSSMAMAAQNALLEACPIFIERLRNNPKLADRIKKMMQEWANAPED